MVASDSVVGGPADFVYEVTPDPDVFDTVRRSVVVTLRSEYDAVLADDVREHVRVDTVVLDPGTWRVEGVLDGGRDMHFDVVVDPDDSAMADVLEYLRKRADARYGAAVDTDAVAFEEVSLRPNVWFVDARIPPQE